MYICLRLQRTRQLPTTLEVIIGVCSTSKQQTSTVSHLTPPYQPLTMQPSFRGYRGMQVHAVPDGEKHVDAQGRRLPWAYDVYSSSSTVGPTGSITGGGGGIPGSGELAEKGPFGRSQKRSRSGLSRSRSKTAEPRREEERVRAEQVVSEDAVFGSLRRVPREGEGEGEAAVGAGAVGAGGQGGGRTTGAGAGEDEATEVMLYGFGAGLEWAALDFYERVGGAPVLEDYARHPPPSTADAPSTLSSSARPFASHTASLSRAALRKKNTFAGGRHWVKVTFSSSCAAERACAASPHVLRGYAVHAEPFLPGGPGRDEALVAGHDAGPSGSPSSSATLMPRAPTSTTTTTTLRSGSGGRQPARGSAASSSSSATLSGRDAVAGRGVSAPARADADAGAFAPAGSVRRRHLSGTTAAIVLPQSAALADRGPRTTAVMAVLGWVLGWVGLGWVVMGTGPGGGGRVAAERTVPRGEDGGLDYVRASGYWRGVGWVDWVLGTDFLGVRGE